MLLLADSINPVKLAFGFCHKHIIAILTFDNLVMLLCIIDDVYRNDVKSLAFALAEKVDALFAEEWNGFSIVN